MAFTLFFVIIIGILILFLRLRRLPGTVRNFTFKGYNVAFRIDTIFTFTYVKIEPTLAHGLAEDKQECKKVNIDIGRIYLKLVRGPSLLSLFMRLSIVAENIDVIIANHKKVQLPNKPDQAKKNIKLNEHTKIKLPWLQKLFKVAGYKLLMLIPFEGLELGRCNIEIINIDQPHSNSFKYSHSFAFLSLSSRGIKQCLGLTSPFTRFGVSTFKKRVISCTLNKLCFESGGTFIEVEGFLHLMVETLGCYYWCLEELRFFIAATANRISITTNTVGISADMRTKNISPESVTNTIHPFIKYSDLTNDILISNRILSLFKTLPQINISLETNYFIFKYPICVEFQQFSMEASLNTTSRDVIADFSMDRVKSTYYDNEERTEVEFIYAENVSVEILLKVNNNSINKAFASGDSAATSTIRVDLNFQNIKFQHSNFLIDILKKPKPKTLIDYVSAEDFNCYHEFPKLEYTLFEITATLTVTSLEFSAINKTLPLCIILDNFCVNGSLSLNPRCSDDLTNLAYVGINSSIREVKILLLSDQNNSNGDMGLYKTDQANQLLFSIQSLTADLPLMTVCTCTGHLQLNHLVNITPEFRIGSKFISVGLREILDISDPDDVCGGEEGFNSLKAFWRKNANNDNKNTHPAEKMTVYSRIFKSIVINIDSLVVVLPSSNVVYGLELHASNIMFEYLIQTPPKRNFNMRVLTVAVSAFKKRNRVSNNVRSMPNESGFTIKKCINFKCIDVGFVTTGNKRDLILTNPMLNFCLESVSMDLDVAHIYLFMDSLLLLTKLNYQLDFNTHSNETSNKNVPLDIVGSIKTFNATVNLYENEDIQISFDSTKISIINSIAEILSSRLSFTTPDIDLPNSLKLLTLNNLNFKTPLGVDRDHLVSLSVGHLVLCISHEYKMYRLVLGVSIFRKCLKRMYDVYFSDTVCTLVSNRQACTNPQDSSTYKLNLFIGKLEIIFTSDWFSDRIYRNHLLGLAEQSCRLKREEEVKKRIDELKVKKGDADSSSLLEVIEMVRKKLQMYNSEVWKNLIDDYEKQNPNYIPKLLTAVSNNISLTLKSLEIPGTSIGAYIHNIDPVTSSSTFWDTVIPVHINLRINDLAIKLREYPHHFLYVPTSELGSIRCVGAIILTDKYPIKTARQHYAISLSQLNLPLIKVTRNVNPIMVYHDLNTEIDIDNSIIATWGASYDPSMIDVIDIIDNFSVTKEDPSPQIGWWDKMRLTFHGKNIIQISEKTEVCFRILGSYVPHFKSSTDCGAEGVELCVRGKTDIEIYSINEITICTSGLIIRLIPESYFSEEDFVSPRIWKNKLIMNLSGSMKIVISLMFLTEVKDDAGNGYSQTHNDIHLVCASLLEKDKVKSHDSYRGFRTRGIKIAASLTCVDSKSLSSGHINNFCSLFNYYIIEKMTRMVSVYQPPLINILTKFKHRKESNSNYNKPVFLQYLESVYAGVEISPLKALIFSERDDFNEVKIKGTTEKFTSEVLVIKKCSTSCENSCSNIRNYSNSSSSQWSVSRLTLAFSNIVGWVSCVPLTITNESFSLHKEGHSSSSVTSIEDKMKDDVGSSKVDPIRQEFNSKFTFPNKKIPFVWSNDVIYSVKPTGDTNLLDTYETGADSAFTYPDIYPTQVRICEDRLRIVSLVLERTRNQVRHVSTFDNKADESSMDISAALKILENKKSILQDRINLCKNAFTHKSGKTNTSDIENDTNKPHDHEMHKHTYKNELLVHNIKILWNQEVRNLVYNLVFWRADRKDENFCGSIFSLQSVYQLVESMSHAFSSLKSIESSRRVSVMLKPKFTFKKQTRDPHNTQWTFKNAKDLLEKLDSEKSISFLTHESIDTISRAHKRDTPPNSFSSKKINDNNYTRGNDFIPIKPALEFCGDFHNMSNIYPRLKVEFINPQICFNSYSVDSPNDENYTYATGDKILLLLDHILQSDLDYKSLWTTHDVDAVTVRSTICSTMYNAQFYAGSKNKILNDYTCDIEKVISDLGSLDNEKKSDSDIPWVPIERILNNNTPVTYLNRVAEAKIATFRYVWPNVLFTKLSCSLSESDYMEKKRLEIPDLTIWLDSDQYFIIYELISNLLIYEHPRVNESNNRLQSALMLLEKTQDIPTVLGSAFALSEKIRSIRAALKGRSFGKMFISTKSPDNDVLEHYKTLRNNLREYRIELSVIVNVLKTIHGYISNARTDISIYRKFSVSIAKGSWIMINNDGTPFAECELSNLTTGYTMFHGKSLLNYLELDHLKVKYLESPYPFEDENFVSPYTPGDDKINFLRHKVIRVYWKENAPVAGIKVIEHFEINLFPISLKLTYGLGKSILKYFFPHKPTHQSLKPLKSKRSESFQQYPQNDIQTVSTFVHANSDIKVNETLATKDVVKTLLNEEKTGLQTSASSTSISSSVRTKQSVNLDSSYFSLKLGFPSLKNIIQHNKQKRGTDNDNIDIIHAPSLNEKHAYSQIMKDISDIKQMQARAREYRSFIYIKIPGAEHCLSYRRSLDKNFEDLENFVFRFPTLEFRNKTWSWTDLFYAVKKECLRILIINTGAIVKEKIFSRKRVERK